MTFFPVADYSLRMAGKALFFKRKSFEHEQELRAFIFQRFDKVKEGPLKNDTHFEKVGRDRVDFIRIKIEPANLIERVYVSPLAKDSFVELVKTVSGKLNAELIDRVQKSDLYELY